MGAGASLQPEIRDILHAVGDGLAVTDAAGRLVFHNLAAEEILRLRLSELTPEAWAELPLANPPDDDEPAEMCVRHAGVPAGVWLVVSRRPLLDSAGRPAGCVTVFRETDEPRRRGIEHRLKQLVDASAYLLGAPTLDRVLPGIIELARKMISVDAYAVWRMDHAAQAWSIEAAHGLSPEYLEETIAAQVHPAMPETPLVFENVNEAPLVEDRRASYAREGIRSLLAVPLRIHGITSGTISFYSRTPRTFDDVEIQAASALGNLSGAAIGAAELYDRQSRMRAEAEQNERKTAFLGEATHLLGSSLEYERTLARVAQLAVPNVADWFTVHTVEEDGRIRLLAVAHADEEKVEWARALTRRYPPDPDRNYGVGRVLRTGVSEVHSITDEMLVAAATSPEHLEMLREVGFTSSMCVPVTARGRTLGAITFVMAESGRRFGPSDLALGEHLGRRAGLAIDNARLYRESQRAFEAARQSETRFRTLFDSGILAIMLGEGSTITEANDTFLSLTGYTRADLASRRVDWGGITPPDSARAYAKIVEQLISNRASAPCEMEYTRKDGTRVPVFVGAAMLDAGPTMTWISFALDLTERKRLEERLRESQKLESIGLLAGGIAHDFNNLLTGIMGNSSLVLDDLPPGNAFRPAIENVLRASERAAHLTRQLLAYSGRGRFVIQPIDISALVGEIGDLLRMSIPKKVELRLDLAPSLPYVEGDSSQIQQLIMNLVLNGAEAIGEEVGTVLVRTGIQDVTAHHPHTMAGGELKPGRYVYIEVRDTGSGMDDATRVRIFDPFFTTKFTGRGLGLAAALGIVRGHHGDIRVYTSPGRGSTFRVLLPAATAQLVEEDEEPPVEAVEGNPTVLLVDDEDVILTTARAALERYGYTVVTATNGSEAVEVFRALATGISVVLLDLTMPLMGGEEAFRKLLQIRPDVKVVVSSGYSEADAARRFSGAGFAGFIQKPYRPAQLAAKIKSALDAAGSRPAMTAGGSPAA